MVKVIQQVASSGGDFSLVKRKHENVVRKKQRIKKEETKIKERRKKRRLKRKKQKRRIENLQILVILIE